MHIWEFPASKFVALKASPEKQALRFYLAVERANPTEDDSSNLWSGQNAIRVTDKHLGIVYGGEDVGFFANAGPAGVGFHHALHHAQVAAIFDIAVFEETVGDDHGSLFGVDRDGHGGAMVHTGPEDANARQNLFFIGEQAQFLPAFVLQVLVHVGRDAQVAGDMEMVKRRLKILDPATPRDADGGVPKHGDVGGGVGLQRGNEHQRNVVGREPLGAQNVSRELGIGAHDLRLGVSEETEPRLVDDGEVLRRAGVDEDVLTAA